MSTRVVGQTKPAPVASPVPAHRGVLQRACACGGTPGPTGECAECRRKKRLGVGSLPLQPKLRVNQPGDRFEQEADRVAEQVMRMPEPDLQRQVDEEEEEELLQTKPLVQRRITGGGDGGEAPPIVHKVLQSPGRPLDPATRAFFEPRFGYDFSRVRVHVDGKAAVATQAVGARAFTVGQNVVFAPGAYAPANPPGQRLLAHELVHVVQQNAARAWMQRRPVTRFAKSLRTPAVQREALEGSSAEFTQPGWVDVQELGIVYKHGTREEKGGANLRKEPQGDLLEWLPQNTKVFILKHHPKRRWYAVTTMGSKGGRFGYIADWLVWRHLPDPEADVVKIQLGDTPIDIARHHYAEKGFNIWGKDPRYVVNALVWVNAHARHNAPGEPGVKKPGTLSDDWFKTKATEGVYIWLPGPAYLNTIYETVVEHGGGTGSISADLWHKVKKAAEYAAYGISFVGGLVHGFVKSLYDAVVGLAKTVIDVLVSIFTGEVLKDAKELWDAVSDLSWDNLRQSLGDWWDKWERKLTSSSPWVSGHAHGYLTGYIMAEAAQLLITGGTLATLKGAIWASRLGRIVKSSRALMTLSKGIEKASRVGGKAREVLAETATALAKSKAFKTLNAARAWAAKALLLPAHVLKDLTLEGINRLRQLPEDVLEKLRGFSVSLKRRALGCASPCKADPKEITSFVGRMTGREVERLAVKESLAYWKGRETLTSFARHKQTFNSLTRTLRNKANDLAKSGQKHLLPVVDDAVLDMPVDEFIRRNPRLSTEWDRLQARSRGNPQLRAEMSKFLEGKTGAGARNVGAREPDIVEFFLESGEVVVTDVTLKITDPVHNFKTLFYREVMQQIVGLSGPKVYGLDIDPTPAFRVKAKVFE